MTVSGRFASPHCFLAPVQDLEILTRQYRYPCLAIRSLLDLVALEQELETLLRRPVDVVTEGSLAPSIRQRITKVTRKRRSEIPSRQIAGMRNRLTHAYFGVDLDLAWRVIERDLAPPATAVGELLEASTDG
jgi:ribonuclease HepT-like protein